MAEAMESAICSEANRSYSWWWDSHITPKNSKWLQENLTNMNNQIKSMIKLIEEDADSFARRAEMYYKKRPELMKLVEEFYRAYRGLAERYDHVTGALRQAHRTLAVAFPNQIQIILPDEPPSGLPDTVEEEKETFSMQSYSVRNSESPDEIGPFMSKEERKHLKEDAWKDSEIKRLQEEVSKLSIENMNLKNQITSESLRADKSETESQGFKDAVSKLKSQLEAAFLQYKVSQERMSYLETEISRRRDEVHHLNDEMSIKVTKLNIAEDQCLDLEKENRSLRFELSKLNEAMQKQMQGFSDLFKENQNLHHTLKIESMHAEKAEAESCRLRDAMLKLNSELGTSLLQYKVSQERISDLEAEICGSRNQLQNFNVEMSMRSLKLNTAEEQYIVLQEENKSLQSTVDRFKMIVEKQEKEVTSREGELCKLKQYIEDESWRYKYDGIQKNLSLQTELNKLKQRIIEHEEELAARAKELDKLKQSLEDEQQRRVIAEVANQSLKKMCSQSEEKIRLLGLEIGSGNELLRRMELNKTGLEEEIKRLHDENNDLNEKSFTSISKIVGLQDEIYSLRRSKQKIADELSFHLDENKTLQQELSFVKIEGNNLEKRHQELMEQIVEANFNVVSLRALVQELLDGRTELKNAYKKHEGEKPFNLKDLRSMESLSEKNSLLLENSLSDVTAELELLREKIKVIEECCESILGNAAKNASENNVMVSHAESVTKNIKKLSDKSTLVENSLSDVICEFKGLMEKVIALEDSFKSLYNQNCYFIAENNNLVAQVENIEQHLERLQNRFSTFEGKHVNMDNEKDLALNQVEELNDLLKSAKLDLENHVVFFNNQTSALNNQIHILKEKNLLINEELEDGLHKTVKSDIDCFITQQVFYDIYEKNRTLSDECHKHIDKLRCAEKLTLELKQDQSTQEKKLALLVEHNKELFEWIQVMVRAFDAKEDSETSNVGYKNMVQFISHKMMDLKASESKEEFHLIHLEKPPFTVLLEQLGLSLAELRAHKNVLEQESEKKNEEISILRSRSYELMEVNEQLRKDLNASNQQKEELNIELEKFCRKLPDLQDAQSSFHCETPMLFAESECVSSKSFDLREQTDSQDEEHEAIFEEFMIHENLFHSFLSSDTEKSSGIDQLISDVYNLHGITNDLGQDIRVINENLRALQTENMHLRDLAVNFETRNSVWLEKENACMDDEKEFLRQSNEKFVGEISRLHKETEALRRREKYLTSELLRAKDVSRCFEEESAAYLLDVNVALINELVFKQKFVELMLNVKSLEACDCVQPETAIGAISPRNVQREDLVKKVDALEKENVGLKAELTSYLPLLVSLDNDTASLEEHNLLLANDHMLSSKREQGNNLLAPLQRKRVSQVRGKDHNSKASAGIMELKNLHAKVKQLQMTVTDTERLLAQEGIVSDTNLANETRKFKARRLKGSRSAYQQGTEKKKDIILQARKSNAADKGVDQEVFKVKHEQMTKYIELDHILSSFGSEDDLNSETYEQAREMSDHATKNVEVHQKIDIMEGERSENPSSELVLDKEFSDNKLEMPINDTKTHQEWSRRVSETLSSDALRLSILQENLEELKKNNEVSEISSQSSSSSSSSITEQLKISEGVIDQLIDINFKLTKMADNFPISMNDNEGRRQISERVQIASEKIDVVELELHNTQCILSKLLEEHESKALKTLHRKSRFPLKNFIHWKRNDSRQKKRRFCACMRLNNKGD